MRQELETRIDIDAPPETVWEILTDLEAYRDWNPFIVSSAGRVAVGERLINRLQSPGGRAMTFKPTVTEVSDVKAFEWLGHLFVPGIFDGRHRFHLEAIDGGTRFIHSESFTGALVRLMRKSVDTDTREGFEVMNAALKARAEARTRSDA